MTSLRHLALIAGLCVTLRPGSAGAQGESFAQLARASLSTINGRLVAPGLRDSVRVLRDPWGVPHIYARNTHDLFFAQGYVHAQDRLWQMEMYRRMYEGRLAELMGRAYVAHDRLARLMQPRHFDDAEYAAYHPEGKAIFQAFADGVNAFVAAAGDNLPVEFRLTGIRPLPWTPQVALYRTQTAMPLADAREELALARQVATLGAAEANRRERPDPYRPLVVPRGVDLSIIGEEVIAALSALIENPPRPPLLEPYAAMPDAPAQENGGAQEHSPGSNNWAVRGRLTTTGRVIVANDPHRNVGNPGIRYLVHLDAPGWSLAGSTEAPLPGVMIGHNGRIAWGLTILGTDQADVYVERMNPARHDQVRWRDGWEAVRTRRDTIAVRGAPPVVVTQKFSRHGPIVFEDTLHHVAYAVRSTMYERGTAGYLGALRLNEAADCRAFLRAQVYYKAPTENMVCGDASGNIAWHASGLAPRRAGWDGRLPVPGDGSHEWAGFRSDLPYELNPARGWIATANHNTQPKGFAPPLFFKSGNVSARFERIASVLETGGPFSVDDFKRLQHDTYSASAARDIQHFRGWTAHDPAVEEARREVAAWDARYERDSRAAAIHHYVKAGLADATDTPAIERALAQGLDSLRAKQGSDPASWRWGRINRSELPHPLVKAYDIPAVERSGGAGTVAAIGATFREIMDFSDLDRSMVTNFPGQSGQPGSPYYANLATSFGRQEYFPLLFSREAVEARAEHRLTLVPR